MNDRKIAIVGGGIGGLSVGIALQRKGFNVSLYEGAPKIQPVGAGLALAANAMKAFMDIGIGDAVLGAGKVLKLLRIKDERGNILTETNSEKITAKLGIINNFTIHRADLHQVLTSQLRPGTLHLNKRCLDWEEKGSKILPPAGSGDHKEHPPGKNHLERYHRHPATEEVCFRKHRFDG